MKLILGIAIATIAVVFVHADFLAYLKELETHRSFQHLKTDEKILFFELVMAAETNTTTEFIDRVGLVSVLELIDRMSFADATKFSAYLSEHLGYHHHRPENSDVLSKRNVEKRDHDEDEDEHNHFFGHNSHSMYSSHMNDAEKKIWDQLKHASETNTVTQFIENHGYGVIFGLIENMSFTDQQKFLNFMEAQLAAEAGTVVKRDSDHGNSDFGHSHHWGGYFDDNLTPEEEKLWKDFQAAAANNNLTEFVEQVGYGPIFGLIENMDPQTMQKFLDMMEAQLQAEAAASTTVPRMMSRYISF